MKITDVRTMLLDGPDPHGVGGLERSWRVRLVRIDTDGGVYGLGEASGFFGDREAIAYAREWLIGRTRSPSTRSSGRCCPAACHRTSRR